MKRGLSWAAGFGVLMWASIALGATEFENTREDPSVPANCRNFEMGRFRTVSKWIYFGIEGSRSAGFTHEIQITRKEAATLWEVMKSPTPHKEPQYVQLERNPRLTRILATLMRAAETRGFDFQKEGDVLEALALEQLKAEYPEKHFFMTGGVAYGATLASYAGELDIIVGRRSDCGIVALGEAKLGVDQKPHAERQIQRFHAVAKSELCSRGEREAICSLR